MDAACHHEPVTSPKAGRSRPPASKLLLLTVALLAGLGVPTMALMFTPLESGVGVTASAAVVGGLGAVFGDVRRGVIVTVWGIVALSVAPVGLVHPAVGAIAVACMGASTGVAATRSLDLPIYMLNAMVAMTMLNPPVILGSSVQQGGTVPPGYVATMVGLATIGGAWGFIVMRSLRTKLPHPPEFHLQQEAAVVYGATLAFLTGWVAAVSLTWFAPSLAGWTILTIYLIARPVFPGDDIVHGMRKKARRRVLGTVVGVIVASVLAALIPDADALILVGLGFLVVAFSRLLAGVPYWQYVALLTPAMVFMDGNGIAVERTGVERVVCTIIGLVLALAALEFNRRLTFPWIARAKALTAGA